MVLRPQRWTLIDDTDYGRITYDGPWIQEPAATWDRVGLNGPPFLDTLHSIRQNGSLTMNFKGNKFSAYGSVRGYSGPPEGLKVWWNCTVDGIESEKDPYPTVDESYHRLCNGDGLEWKEHTFVIKVTSKDNEPFYFDTMDYWHGINETRTNRRSIVRIDDEELYFSPGSWSNRGGIGFYKITNVRDSSVKFPFDGVSVAWYGGVVTGMSQAQSSATWSVDGSPPTEFKLPGPSENGHRTKFFETPKLTPGTHMLEVVYKGDVSVAPLTLWQLYIDHGGLPDSFDSIECGKTKVTDVKVAAVGGALGAALVLVVGLLIFFFTRYHGKREPYKKSDSAEHSADARPHGAEYSAIQRYDAETAQVPNIIASSAPPQQSIDESMYAGHVPQVPATYGSTLRTRAVPPTRTGKGFVQTRHGTVGAGTPPLDTLPPGSSNGGSSLAREEDPPVYSPDSY